MNFGVITQRPTLIVAFLSLLFVCMTLRTSLQKSPAFDEPFHLASGLLYVQTGRIVRTPDHPPLARELSGLTLYAAGVRLPHDSNTAAVVNGQGGDLEYPIGYSIIAENGPERVMFWARLPFLLLGGAFIWSVYFFGRALVGEAEGICAAFLCTFDPLVLSNFGLVYTDAPVALFALLTMMALWFYIQHHSWSRILWTGLALGAALGTKYSAVVLVPAIALLLIAAWRSPTRSSADIVDRKTRQTLWASNYFLAFACICAAATCLLLYIFLWPVDPSFYRDGMGVVNRNHNPQWLYYLGGHYARHFYRYYVEAWLLKEPLATIALTIVGIVALRHAPKIPRLACLFLVVPSLLLLAGYSLFSDHLGVRYIMPVLPFWIIAAGAGLAELWRKRARGRLAAVLLSAWVIEAAIGVYPDHMNYFNESACLLSQPSRLSWDGGTSCGSNWLDDSNIDSGQALKELRVWLDRNASGKRVYFGYFGNLPPQIYGLPQPNSDYATVMSGTEPGLYVVSAQILARAHPGLGSLGGDWLLHARPTAFIGHTYFVYNNPVR